MDDIDQMLINEVRACERAIKMREVRLEQIIQAQGGVRLPKRYVLEYDFVPGSLDEQTKSFVVSQDISHFRCTSVTTSLTVFGNNSTRDVPVVLTLAPADRMGYFAASLRFRDTGSNREWQNNLVPEFWMTGGTFGPAAVFGKEGILHGSAEVSCDVVPTASYTSYSSALGIDEFTLFRYQVSVIGTEVRR